MDADSCRPERGRAVPFVKHGCDHIFFIGFLGAGKTTLARNLGGMFRRPYVDTDRLVERQCGRSISRIFRQEGEAGFRKRETRVLRSLARERSLLVSCGGGIVGRKENVRLMRQMGTVVYLEGDFSDSLRQIRSVAARPDFKSREHAERLFERLRPLYVDAADLTLDIRGKSFQEVSYCCAELLLERGLI